MEYKIAVIPGDGIGPEVVRETLKVLDRIGEKFGHEFKYTEVLAGGCAIDATGHCLPEETVMVGDNFTHDIQGALDVGIDGVWLNWTDKPKPVGELSYTEVSTFEQAAAHIRTLL